MRNLTLRDYQKLQFDFLTKSDENTCIQAPTGCGKSVVIEAYIQHLLKQGKKRIAVITPSQELVKNIKDYFGVQATMAFTGETPNIYAPIFITTFQSAGKYMKMYEPEHYISDECFVAGTLIDGKPIDQYLPGDYVTAWDEKTNDITRKKVLAVSKKYVDIYEILELTFDNQVTLKVTKNHPFYTLNRGWINAEEILSSDILPDLSEGLPDYYRSSKTRQKERKFLKTTRLASRKIFQQGIISKFINASHCKIAVFNLEIEDYNTYFAESMLVHNCHLSVCQLWQDALNPSVRHDGFTATPNRLDGKPLKGNFSKLYKSPPIQWFIDREYLAPFDLTICDYPEFCDNKSDNLGTQQEIFGTVPEIEKSIDVFMEKSRNEKTLFFVTGINHGLKLEEYLKKYGIDASFIDSKTSKTVRNRDFEAFKFGDKQVLININLFTTGIDVPECSSVYACRFTYSPTIHFQMAGRGWRYVPGKTFKYFDLSGNCWYHGSPTMPYNWSLDGDKNPKGINKESLYHRCSQCYLELVLRRSVTEPIVYDCPQCCFSNYLFPKTRLGNTGKELLEHTLKLLKLPSEMRALAAHIISIERSTKMSVLEKITAICECDAPVKLKRLPLKRLGLNKNSIRLFTSED